MSRYIDADELKASYIVTSTTTNSLCHLYVSIEDINNAPSIDIPQWIPCSERLPEEDEEVLVCDVDGTMEVCDLEMFGEGRGLKWTDKNGYESWLDVIAWMPLPKPYGEREGE